MLQHFGSFQNTIDYISTGTYFIVANIYWKKTLFRVHLRVALGLRAYVYASTPRRLTFLLFKYLVKI